jgi:hypothetical protein
MLKGRNDSDRAKDKRVNVEVLLRQGLNNETLGEKGSLRCRNPRP